MNNLFASIPSSVNTEIFDTLLQQGSTRIERIVSYGQTSPETGWYDQDEHEWVLVLCGAAQLTFADGRIIDLKPGDYVNIASHEQHRVSWTDPDNLTVWLAVFYSD